MTRHTSNSIAAALLTTGVVVICGALGFRALFESVPYVVTVATSRPSPTTRIRPLNREEALGARLDRQVKMPPDLVTLISTKDKSISRWIDNWQEHRPADPQQITELQELLRVTPLNSEDLWRLARQIDRGADHMVTPFVAAASVDRAAKEIAAGNSRIPMDQYVLELSKLKTFLFFGPEPSALESWAELIMHLPANLLTPDLVDSSRLAVIGARVKQARFDDAELLATQLQVESTSSGHRLSALNDADLHYSLGTIAENQGRLADALQEFERIPAMNNDERLLGRQSSAVVLERLGRHPAAIQRAAEVALEFKLSDAQADAMGQYVVNRAATEDLAGSAANPN